MNDDDYDKVLKMLSLFPDIEMTGTKSVRMSTSVRDECVAQAIREMQSRKTLRRPSDYTYIMVTANEEFIKGLPFFYSPQEFLNYLRVLDCANLPGRSTLYDTQAKINGRFPDWTILHRRNA